MLKHSSGLPHAELVSIAEEFGPAYAAAVASRAEFSALIDLQAMEKMDISEPHARRVIEAGEQTGS